MRQVIAKVKLNPGSGGYFDPITRIHLTHGNPIGCVYAGMNTTGLHSAVRNRRISIIEGSLGAFNAPFKLIKNGDGKIVLAVNDNKKKETVKQDKPKKITPKVEPKEEIKVESAVEKVEEVTNKAVAEEKWLPDDGIHAEPEEIVIEPPVAEDEVANDKATNPEIEVVEEVTETEVPEETKKTTRRKKKK